MSGQNTAAAERSAHARPPSRAGEAERAAGLGEVAPGVWRLRAFIERDELRVALAQRAPSTVGGIASGHITVKVLEGATAAELLSMAALYAAENMRATPAVLRAGAAALVETANRIEAEGRR